MPQYWTDELTDRIAKEAKPWHGEPANLLAWACLCSGCLTAAFLIALVLRVWR